MKNGKILKNQEKRTYFKLSIMYFNLSLQFFLHITDTDRQSTLHLIVIKKAIITFKKHYCTVIYDFYSSNIGSRRQLRWQPHPLTNFFG